MRRLLLSLLLSLSSACAQVVLLPLDSRPATSDLPARIAGLTGEPVSVPSPDLLGDAKTGADPAQLGAWLEAQPPGPLVASLDALAYGGLVQSRTSSISAEEAIARLAPIRAWKERTGQPVLAFITLPRSPDATDRARNLAVVREMISWAREGVFQELHVTWDDARTGSPAPQEGAALRADAPPNVKIYPGADEVLASLVARVLDPAPRRLAVEFSDPVRAGKVAQYEGISLVESVARHADAAGWEVVPTQPTTALTPFGGPATRPEEPTDLYLYVYDGGNPRAAALRVSQLLRSGPVAVADVASVNSGNVRLWGDLGTLGRPQSLASLAAWGTPGNNIGTALAHAKVLLGGADPARQDELLARQVANDVIYGAYVRPELRKAIPEAQLSAPQTDQTLEDLAKKYFPLSLKNTYDLADASLPWNRSFEWRFDLKKVGSGEQEAVPFSPLPTSRR